MDTKTDAIGTYCYYAVFIVIHRGFRGDELDFSAKNCHEWRMRVGSMILVVAVATPVVVHANSPMQQLCRN